VPLVASAASVVPEPERTELLARRNALIQQWRREAGLDATEGGGMEGTPMPSG